ncbi:MAG: AAA family ATPase [Thermoleophilia bacterium]
MLLEREAEIAAVADALAAARAHRGSVLLVAGPPGAGKTGLLAEARALAGEAGVAVLSATGSALEGGYGFGVVRQLLEGPLTRAGAEDRAELLGGPASRAAAVLDPAAGDGDAEEGAAVHALYWLVANLADRAPLLLRVDDAQWADEASLRFLSYLARRCEDLRVVLLVGCRAGEVPPALAGLEERATRLEPAPLGPGAIAALLTDALGEEPVPGLVSLCRARTGGNPFLVRELVAEVRAAGPAGAWAAAEALPSRVEQVASRRLDGLGAEALAMARSLAVLGDGADLLLVASLADVTPAEATAAADALTRAGLLEDDHPLRFRHPLLQAAVDAGTPAVLRGAAHSGAAVLLAGRGAPPGRVAAHLLQAPPGGADPWVVQALRDGARDARGRGTPREAAALLRRALAEPPEPADRDGVLRDLADAELADLRPEAAEPLAAVLDALTDPLERADAALRLAISLYHSGRHSDAVDRLLAAIADLGDDPAEREARLRLEAFMGVAGRYDLATEERTRGRLAGVAAGLAGATPAERLVIATAALEDPGPTAGGLAEAARLGEAAEGETPWPDPGDGAALVAMHVYAARLDRAEALTARMIARARDGGSPLRNAIAIGCVGMVALDRGDLRAAVPDLRASQAALAELGSDLMPTTAGILLFALAEAGEVDEADALLAARGLQGDIAGRMLLNPLLHGRAVLHGAARRWEASLADWRALGGRHARWGMSRPLPPWRSGAALALAASGGDRDEARALAAEELAIAEVWGTPKPIAVARRAVALLGDDDAAIEGLEAALAVLEGTPWALERARARADLGAALRRAGRRREAREALMVAMDEAHACGAEPVAAFAAEESRASGARPRRHALSGVASLTPSERRVATLVAAGRSNREVAHELFVTLATVETHLTRVYRKLGIPGRSALAAAMQGG